MIEAYRTIAGPVATRLTRKKSRFIALLYPVSSEAGVERILKGLRREYHDATHRCSAYRLVSGAARADDAGEPAGSAGPPILQALEGAGLYDVLAVVVRYFGGVKLGIGGLIRAYGDAARAAIEAAEIVTRVPQARVEVSFPPDLSSPVMGLVHRFGAKVEGIDYGTVGTVRLLIPKRALPEFSARLGDATGGRGGLREME